MSSECGNCRSYYDSTLYPADVDLLSGPAWLNDNVINFYFEYLTHDVFARYTPVAAFLGPSVAFMLAFCDENDAKELLEPLNLSDKEFVFLPLNDNASCTAAGGTHWTLLMFVRSLQTFFFCNSQAGGQQPQRDRVACTLSHTLSILDHQTISLRVPQQLNSYDCGVYVCAFTKLIMDWAVSEGGLLGSGPCQYGTETVAAKMEAYLHEHV
eukprot:CAMPEP_0177669562 /NCGR_PEP_ID=MMETSP0447-20121125/23527_1 /TAXON_ID=0 /ORGANISM="Stygamoeba regulata, Strain BSH-02190019" /LENGTH=210 /DNA_ID=CAMNT_0019176477 /DNA_START=186 /DNA_END=815 /DNA_ORIENTATION=+